MNLLGFDIGGTNTRCVVVAYDKKRFRVITSWSFSTPRTRRSFLYAIEQAVVEAKKKLGRQKLVGIGIGVPGPLSADRTKILAASNAPQIYRLALPAILQKRFRIPVRMENDADVFALAEAWFGAGRGFKRVLGVTVGTGIGSGLVVDGHIDRGAHGSAGEIGHMVIEAKGRKCSCGGRGHLEEYVSHRAFLRETGMTPKDLLFKARQGNAQARRFYLQFGETLGLGIASAVNLWDPDIVVVGGGIGQAGELLLGPVRRRAKKEILSPLARRALKIKPAKFGKYSGAIGAALLFTSE